MLHVKAISNSFDVVGDVISKQDQMDYILNDLPEEYNMFIMKTYGTSKPQTRYNVEAFLYVQEVHLEKFQ